MNHFSFDKVETYAVRIRMVKADNKRGTSITEVQIFAKQVAAAKQGQTRIQVDGKELANFNPDLTDYYLESVDGKFRQSQQVLATMVSLPSFQAFVKVSQFVSSRKLKMATS